MNRLWLGLALAPLSFAWARPVSFYEGFSLMSESRSRQNDVMFDYSFDPRFSVGLHYSQLRADSTEHFTTFMLNALVVRQSGDTWQSNVYLSAGAGGERVSGQTQATADVALEADAETRRWYLSTRVENLGMIRSPARTYARARAGFAPYLAEANGLHMWILAQEDFTSALDQRFETSPLLRVSYQNVLFELGSSFRGQWQFNFATEF